MGQQSRIMTRITWTTFVEACSRAGIVLADDQEAVTARLVHKAAGDQMMSLEPFDGSRHHIVWEADNRAVTADGSSVFVIADVAGAGRQEMQLHFYKTWVVEDDLSIRK